MHDGEVRCPAESGRPGVRFIPVLILTLILEACTSAVPLGTSSRSVASSAHPRQNRPSSSANPVDTATLIWTQGGLPHGFAERVSRMPEVTHAVTVVAGTVWLTRSLSASRNVVDHPPHGYAIPLDLAGARPQDLAPFLPAKDRSLVGDLRAGEAILGATSARLRRLGPGGTLMFGDRRLRVAGVLPDRVVGGHEVFVSRQTAATLGVRSEQYLLLQAPSGIHERQIRRFLPPDALLRIRPPGQAHFLRQADAVLSPVMLKAAFGEFAASPRLLPGEWLRISTAWENAHITSASVPILGTVRCNTALIPQLHAALREVERRGLSQLIHSDEFAGCFAARIIPGNVDEAISAHTWGAALDINARSNPLGADPTQDPRIVAIFKRWGFTWGGAWMRPDGMHFEFQCFPRGMGDGSVLACPPGGAMWPPEPSPSGAAQGA